MKFFAIYSLVTLSIVLLRAPSTSAIKFFALAPPQAAPAPTPAQVTTVAPVSTTAAPVPTTAGPGTTVRPSTTTSPKLIRCFWGNNWCDVFQNNRRMGCKTVFGRRKCFYY